MMVGTSEKRRRKFRLIAALRSWWKRRRFQYLVEDETHAELGDRVEVKVDGHADTSTGDDHNDTSTGPNAPNAASNSMDTPLTMYFITHTSNRRKLYPFQRASTLDSFQDSIESLDSVMDSHWDPDDNSTSQITARITNCHGDTYLMEHLNFLSVSTQPQEVELMYDR
ncbi:hypothetical protein IV203_005564 [Nitzschia inconspicua]|uniref:Uncharacterized protein n=1 Tax=Nitzschia inconspicua TaxID=303405 RepID=A0A9K3PH16_9STRA|nr:hypothetical protein IV203_005564 [Nitzschia inconspicua]